MKVSRIFNTGAYKQIERNILGLMNGHVDFMSETTASSPRASGDAIQEILCENFEDLLGEHCGQYSDQFARRAMADFAFTDPDGLYYVVDVKTHRLDTHFNMPNLTSVERLTRFYEDDKNFFVVLNVAYEVNGTALKIRKVHFVPIEYLSWDCLTIGALGWGQIQIANSNNIIVNTKATRREWMLEFCNTILDFYPKEILKIDKRIQHFNKTKEFWAKKVD